MAGTNRISEKCIQAESNCAAVAGLKRRTFLVLLVLAAGAVATPVAAAVAPPDLVVLGSRIETLETTSSGAGPVEAFAVTDGKFSYVGSATEALRLAGPKTRIERIGDRRLVPGLVDTHVHATRVIELNTCDLKNEARSLAQIAGMVRECLTRFRKQPGEWLRVAQWAIYSGNEPDAQHPTLRAALDLAAPNNPVQLMGTDGHHAAFNSAALRLTHTPNGEIVGLSRATLAGPLAHYRPLVDVGADGEPTGGVNEEARLLVLPLHLQGHDLSEVKQEPGRITKRLNSVGITAFQDPSVPVTSFAIYDKMQAQGELTAHASLATLQDLDAAELRAGGPDWEALVAEAVSFRERYRDNPLIRADTVKLFVDGVMEGNPLGIPPTLPNSPSLTPYLQPVFGKDERGRATFSGQYQDPQAPECRAIAPPPQCAVSSGRLQHGRAVIMEYARRMHQAGLTLHIHAISDAAVRTALDAIEAARADDKPGTARRADTLAHVQLVHPDDMPRIGRNQVFLAMTYAWIYTAKEYDLSVIPFIQRVRDDSFKALHEPDSYYERQAYPTRSMMLAGGVLTGGSDAPVETRDPRPFMNMEIAVLRARGGTPPLGQPEAISIGEALRAYTINGARALGRETEFGSIAVGKSADFIVLDRVILSIPSNEIGGTRVLQTWFQGKRVFTAK
jgi:predicted amidohydrolase YtcJ